jgi:hypothetical protein
MLFSRVRIKVEPASFALEAPKQFFVSRFAAARRSPMDASNVTAP